ncbi:MAG: hypothetical protein KKH94_01730 [Candidatus Omnitrophica bacterium]|nr:hypothetical protein [Candidatus Omnitrophota bacterium]
MDDIYQKKVHAAKKVHEKARYFRGRFLNSMACIERDIAVILTKYFCTNDETKRELFFSKVMERLSLNKKKEILIAIVKKDYPRYWEENKQCLIDLQKLQEFRNKLAHSVVDVSDDALNRPVEEGIGFIQWDKGAPITDTEFDEWQVRTSTVISVLDSIKRLLPFKEKPID